MGTIIHYRRIKRSLDEGYIAQLPAHTPGRGLATRNDRESLGHPYGTGRQRLQRLFDEADTFQHLQGAQHNPRLHLSVVLNDHLKINLLTPG